MAPLPPESTGRLWLRYSTGGGVTAQEHELMIRFNPAVGGSATVGLDTLGYLLTEMGEASFFDGWTPVSARYAADGSVISLPLALPSSLTTFVGAGQAIATLVDQARELRFVGRSDTTGRRGSVSFYGVVEGIFNTADFRIPRVELNIVDRFLDVVEESSGPYFCAIDESQLTWRDYGNWQFNSYWERQLRV